MIKFNFQVLPPIFKNIQRTTKKKRIPTTLRYHQRVLLWVCSVGITGSFLPHKVLCISALSSTLVSSDHGTFFHILYLLSFHGLSQTLYWTSYGCHLTMVNLLLLFHSKLLIVVLSPESSPLRYRSLQLLHSYHEPLAIAMSNALFAQCHVSLSVCPCLAVVLYCFN